MEPLLSILIPTVYGREKSFGRLVTSLQYQIQSLYQERKIDSLDCIEVLSEIDDKKIPIGMKRESLYKSAKGIYSLQVDDDDALSDNAIELILKGIVKNPTHIGYRERCLMNGMYHTSNHSNKYDKWQDCFDGFDYVRTIFYKDPIRTELARQVPFPPIRYNEDEQWSYAIKHLMTNEYYINEEVYHYIYEPKDTHEERYGIK